MSFRLFVSHSNPGLAKDVADELERGGRQHGLRVLVDAREITTGDVWRERISYMLCSCDAALLLLDEKALRSPWVLAEATYLSLRSGYTPSGERPFRLFPVALLAAEQFAAVTKSVDARQRLRQESAWDVADLGRLQFARGCGASQIARDVLTALRGSGGLTAERSPTERLAQQMALLLDGAGAGALEELADALADDRAERSQPAAVRVGLGLIRAVLAGAPMTSVRARLDGLGSGLSDDAESRVIAMLEPLPFDVAAAVQLRRAGSRCAGMRTAEPRQTVDAYLRLAHLPEKAGVVLYLQCVTGTVESVRDELVESYRLRTPRVAHRERDAIEDRLRSLHAYVVVPTLDAAVLTELAEAYPGLVFVAAYPGPERPVLPPDATMVAPDLDPEREREIWEDIDNAFVGLAG